MIDAENRRARRKAEEQVRLQSAALEAAANSIVITDREGRILWVNRAFTQHTGYSFEEVRSKNLRLLKSGKQDQAFYEKMWKTILAGKVWRNTIINRRKDGTLNHEDLTITPIRTQTGEITHFVGIKQDLTEKTQAAEAQQASELRYQRLFESARDGILILDAMNGQIVDVNPFLIEMLGYSKEELMGKELWEIGVFKDIVASKAAFVELQGQGFIRYEDLPLETRSRQVKQVEFVSNSYQVNGSRVIQCNIRDITERKQAADALAESENRLRAILETEPECVKLLAADGSLIDMNPAGLAMIEADSLEQVKGNNVCLLALPEHRPAFMAANRRVFAGESVTLEFEISGIRGTRRWLEMHATPLRDKDGAIIAALGVTRDVTDRKSSAEALREGEERLRLALDASHLGTFDWDVPHNRLTWSRWHEEMWGFEPGEFDGTYEAFSERVHAEDLPGIDAELARCIAAHERFSREFRVVWRDGSVHWIAGSGEFEFSANGQPARMLGSVMEITERRQAEEESQAAHQRLARALGELQAKNEELASMTQQLWQASKLATMGELAASVAHELNNPLATVGLRTENLLLKMPADSDKRRPLEIIAQEVDRMATLVNNLLQFSRRGRRQVSTVDPREEIANSVEFVHYHLRTHKIEIVREFADPLPTIQADRQQLRQLFLNLLTNASDAMPKGGKLIVRAASGRLSGAEAVVIEFADSGEGIATEDLAKLWEPFFTTKPEGKGTGLGLAICRRIVEEHGGTIAVHSEGIGRGATFRVVLPATTKGALS